MAKFTPWATGIGNSLSRLLEEAEPHLVGATRRHGCIAWRRSMTTFGPHWIRTIKTQRCG